MDLTTLERVYVFDGQLPDNKDKEMVKMIISAVSNIVEKYLDRTILKGTYTETFDVPQYTDFTAWVKAYPVNLDEEIQPADPDADPIANPLQIEDNGVVMDLTDIDINPRFGWFQSRVPIDWGMSKFKITYYGGMADSTADFISLYPDIEYEVIKQVVFEYKRKKMMTQLSTGAGGNSSETYAPFVLQPSLQKVLRRHRRASIG